ncbi:serine protease [Paenibacillus validus]|uniref:trypsin-like serine peptidase n=1 Tax=Paenibacillus validus TaxID=44253 RepID=UPI000FD799E6|nr:serine protease [Paenibacillus validus]MED4601596.1 serine protease [Paenibacillus validus]MED4607618.1 serine protease [Paenibacillus validus]
MTTIQHVANFIVSVGRITPDGVNLLGTAFVVAHNKLATTKHVTNGDDTNLIIIVPKVRSINEYQDTSDNKIQTIKARICEIDPFKDICILTIEHEVATQYHLSSTDTIQPGSPVITYGFPHANHGRLVLTQQDTHVGAKILIDSNGIKSKHIVLNTLARPGQSGGPVFNPSNMSIIGMLIGAYIPNGGSGVLVGGIDPASLNQTTHVISAEYIREMI